MINNCLLGSSSHIAGVLLTDKSGSFWEKWFLFLGSGLESYSSGFCPILPSLLYTIKNYLIISSSSMFIINTYSLMVFNSPSLGLTSLSHFGLMGNFPEHFPAQRTLQQPPSQAFILCHVLLPPSHS